MTTLLRDISRSVFWNTALLPATTIAGLLLSIVIRRSFGLQSGVYDAVLGVVSSVLFYSSLGLSGALPKFLPELQMGGRQREAAILVWRLGWVRLGVLGAILLVMNVWADPIGRWLGLGSDGAWYLHVASVLLVGRAMLDYLYRTLDSFLQQLAVNLLSVLNGILDVCFVAVVVALGWHIAGAIGGLGVSALITAGVAMGVVKKRFQSFERRDDDRAASPLTPARIWKLSAVTYLRDLSLYFATPAFASPALLTTLGGPGPVAIFATGYFVASSTVTLVVSGFRGIYRPAFARVLATGDRAQLRRALDLMNKIQILAVVPAGFGLAVMVGDYLPLLYGQPFVPAIPVARVLVVLLFAETMMAVALLVLWVDERYRLVLGAQAVMIAGAPLFVWAGGRVGLLAAALVLGASRLGASVFGYIAARRLYGTRYPWPFAWRVTLVSLIMATTLVLIRRVWPTSVVEAATLTILGVLIVGVGFRALEVMGPEELDVLSRSSVPGKRYLLDWLQKPSRLKTR